MLAQVIIEELTPRFGRHRTTATGAPFPGGKYEDLKVRMIERSPALYGRPNVTDYRGVRASVTASWPGSNRAGERHHANLNRHWNMWLAQGGGRTDPVFDTTWTSKMHVFFDENGAAVKMNACQILRAAQQLRYVYKG